MTIAILQFLCYYSSMNSLPVRKSLRLENYDYSLCGAYFLTICVKDMYCLLSDIVGSGAPDAPQVCLKEYGEVIEKEITKMNGIYENIKTEKYVIMPNHVHLLVIINNSEYDGASRAPLPTNSLISKYVGTLKRFCNKQYGKNIWQTGFYDHIIRNEEDMHYHLQYIDENPKKWLIGKDKYYI